MHAFDVEHEQLIASIEKKIQHKYLEQHIKKPSIEEAKVFILSNIVDKTTLPPYKKKHYIITTMLVQIALDTHDLVPIANGKNENKQSEITRQLSVLAGDYYSGLYYLLLAQIEDIEMVDLLASAIKEINEHKMNLYYKEEMSFDEYVNCVEKINALLIVRVADHLNCLQIFQEITSRILITGKLIDEKRNIHNQNLSPILNNWLNHCPISTHNSILSQTETIIEKNTRDIEFFISQSSDQITIFRNLLDYLLNELIYKKTTIVEEG